MVYVQDQLKNASEKENFKSGIQVLYIEPERYIEVELVQISKEEQEESRKREYNIGFTQNKGTGRAWSVKGLKQE